MNKNSKSLDKFKKDKWKFQSSNSDLFPVYKKYNKTRKGKFESKNSKYKRERERGRSTSKNHGCKKEEFRANS